LLYLAADRVLERTRRTRRRYGSQAGWCTLPGASHRRAARPSVVGSLILAGAFWGLRESGLVTLELRPVPHVRRDGRVLVFAPWPRLEPVTSPSTTVAVRWVGPAGAGGLEGELLDLLGEHRSSTVSGLAYLRLRSLDGDRALIRDTDRALVDGGYGAAIKTGWVLARRTVELHGPRLSELAPACTAVADRWRAFRLAEPDLYGRLMAECRAAIWTTKPSTG
jgi:hypothetical protein